MKAVLDTNIFISGIHWHGVPRKVLSAWYSGKFKLITSMPIIDELVDALKRFKITLSEEELDNWQGAIKEKSILVAPNVPIWVAKDPDDNKFIEAAVEAKADFIVSRDKHLLQIKKYDKIEILTPEEFLEKIC